MDNTKDKLLQRRSKLSPTQRSLLEKRLRGEVDSQLEVIPKRSQISPAPLSFAQQRLWFLHQLDPDNPYYSELACVQLLGALNVHALEKSFNEIVQRHEALRTTFEIVEEQAVQVIHPAVTVKLPVVKLDLMPEIEQQAQIEQLTTEIAQKPFDLATVPLLRTVLLQIDVEEYLLVFAIHHIVVDGWSIGVLIRELVVLYEAFSTNKTSPLAELPIQYADFGIWQRQWLQGELQKTQLDYWKQQLAGAATLALPTDRSRPPVQSFRGAVASFELSTSLTDMLRDLSNAEGVTLFMTLLAAFQALLYRYTGQEDICVGSPIANRNQGQIQGLIGFFVNTLVLRTDLAGNPSFLELLNRVRQVCVGAYAHADIPFEQLVEELQPDRNLSQMPLFQVMFAWQEDTQKQLTLPNLILNWLPTHTQTARFDLTLHIVDASELRGLLEYNTDLFDAETITRIVEHFRTFLQGIVVNPQTRSSDLPILTTDELNQQLLEWNDTAVEYPQQQCIHQLFEAQVERTPDAVAVVFEDEQLTYWELNTRANQLAHYLQQLGVKPEVLVGICVERSLSMIIGLLAILKAGGAYVPLDPAYPQERLTYILEDAAVSVLLTQQQVIENLPQHQTRVVCLDTDWESIAQQSSQNPISECTTDNLAYIIYTSGSTGQPKGVLVNHSNVVRLLAATQSWYNFNQQDVWTLFHSITFDFSVWEIWGALLYGGQLVVVPYWLSRSPQEFYQLLLTQQVTILNQTPSAFRQLIQVEESLENTSNLNLRKVIFGGEALQIESLRPWFERHGDQSPQLVNMYGITETTVHVTYRPLTMADLELASASLIGRPIGDLQVYLLDKYGQPVPIGVPGEMYIGGAGVVRGYLNRPELTPVKFIPNPFSDKFNARLYKSGDLARYLPNGDIEYLGRIDHQVKIRGFRIELGEIEALISQYPAVREAVVVVHENSAHSQRIVAYVVPQKEQTLTISELRGFLESKLPSYMIPAAFVILEVLPLTQNGKIDRRALPIPDSARPELEEAFVVPRTKEEEILADIWVKVLGVKQVGIHDNFFSLGGDSIRSIQVQSLAQKHGLNFSIQQLFRFQTIYELAKTLVAAKESNTNVKPVEPFSLLSQADRQKLPDDLEDAYPLSQLQAGMLFHSISSPNTAIYHNVTSLHLKAPFDLEKLQIAIQELVVYHPVLRTSFELEKYNELIQLVHKNISIPLQVEDLRHLCVNEQENVLAVWFEAEKSQKFDWTRPPLLRFHIHRRAEETFQFSFTEHHVILDGWSVASMVTELFSRYLSLLGKKISLPNFPPTIAYRDFIALERAVLKSDECLQYWRQKLHNSTVTTIARWLNGDRVSNISRNISVHNVELSVDVSVGLKQLAQVAGIPVKSILLAAHLRVLSLLSGETDVVTGLVSNGRLEEVDGERTLGLFLNTLPFRLQLSGETWLNLVQRTFDTERELLPHRQYPLAELQRILGQQPLFETTFNFTNFHVYQGIVGLNEVQLLSSKYFAVTNFALCTQFSLDQFSSEIHLDLEYDVREFSYKQIESIGGYYARTLAAIAAEPKKRYESISLLSPEEQHQLLLKWNDTAIEYPEDKCIHKLFEAQVERTPDAVAVVFESQQLTYCELNIRANQLAHYLQQLGVKPEVLVGICVERSPFMVIALLAILKAGGAYIPLDPNYPQERLSFMLEDSRPSVLLTQQHLVENFLTIQAQVICIDRDWQLIPDENRENPGSKITVDNLAYVIYTSGSTGKPKGAMNTHKGICNRLLWMQDAYQLTLADNVLQKTPFSFDVSVWEFFWTLITGARLVVAQPEGHKDPNYIVNLILQQRITTLHFVPSMLQVFLSAEGLEKCQSLVRVIASGEALPVQLQQSFCNRLDAQLYNLYGPTEAAVDVTFWQCEDSFSNQKIVPVGRPIANIQIYLLDKYFNPVPIGVAGEVYIGGVGVGRGYFHRPDLTAEKFIPNPFSDKATRLYKTGDLARYLPTGEIEYIGRIDHQVKIRGFRIELPEIETVITQHLAVRETVVVVHDDSVDSQRIVAYVVPQKQQTLTISELRSFLESKLPNYMIPAAFVILETLPLTPNGKLDRKALPAPDTARSQLEAIYQPPQTEVEQAIADIWQKILNVENVGIYDNFFQMGGHSLLLVQVHSNLVQALKSNLSIIDLFRYPTISSLADYLSQVKNGKLSSELVDVATEKIADGKVQQRKRLQKMKSIENKYLS
ncbi:MAG: amino acid adenylation domain-containing protein [Nostoc sp. CreGUA01]|nr:amino acid adenylation domain-containing protein [Nostoc sp. CreGUA01]